MNQQQPKVPLKRAQPYRDTPGSRLYRTLQKDVRRNPLWLKLLILPHRLTMFAITQYFDNEQPVTEELVKARAESERENPSNVSASEQNEACWRRFATAAGQVRNPLYKVPAFTLVSLLTTLNYHADLLNNSPVNKALWNECFDRMNKQTGDPRWIRDVALDLRPLFLTWFCLVPPIALVLMIHNLGSHVVTSVRGKNNKDEGKVSGYNCLTLRQNIDQKASRPTEFYNSAWFNPVVTIPYLIGIPTAISMWIYFHLGVDSLFGFPSRDPHFQLIFEKIGLYLYGLGACLSVLFFKSYFTFAWNFLSPEYNIEIYPDMIKRLPVKGWFRDFMTLSGRRGPCQINWNDVTSVTFSTATLPTDKAKRDNLALSFLRKVATIYQAMAQKMDMHSDYLEIGTTFGRSISINLWELTAQQKLEVFQALRMYCPSVYLNESVQNALVGSSVMREPRYTEIWFDVLSSNSELSQQGDLVDNQQLHKGKYTVVSKLASGGQAVLYKALDTSGQIVVLKEFQLTPGESFNAKIESAKDFENESALLSQLSHEAIAKMLDMFYENGRVYIVLEHVEGKTLREVIQEGTSMTPQQILNLAGQLSSILAYLHAHEPPVVHRDFTPDNIIMQPDGKLKLIDFSVAQRKLNKERGDCAGKHAYTPPEQFAGQACPQSDIYALGATLYFLATGSDPVPITNSSLPASNETELQVLNDIISKCTKLTLAERYLSVDWLSADLGRYLCGSGPDLQERSNGDSVVLEVNRLEELS